MKIFVPSECEKKPRADMYLPIWVNILGILVDLGALALLVAAFITQTWALIMGFVAAGVLGVAANLCWKNQKINMIDDYTFEYTTFLGKTTRYRFSDIRGLKSNTDSMTLFVGEGKVHIESCAIISATLVDRINTALPNQ